MSYVQKQVHAEKLCEPNCIILSLYCILTLSWVDLTVCDDFINTVLSSQKKLTNWQYETFKSRPQYEQSINLSGLESLSFDSLEHSLTNNKDPMVDDVFARWHHTHAPKFTIDLVMMNLYKCLNVICFCRGLSCLGCFV